MRLSFSPVIVLAIFVATSSLIGIAIPVIGYSNIILFHTMVLIEITRTRYLARVLTR